MTTTCSPIRPMVSNMPCRRRIHVLERRSPPITASPAPSTIENGSSAQLTERMIYFADYAFENGSWVPQGHADLTQFFVDRHKGNFELNGGYLDISPNYDPIDGYTPNSDIRGPQFFTDLSGASPAIKNYTLFFTADRFLDDSGAVHQADLQSSSPQSSRINSRSTAPVKRSASCAPIRPGGPRLHRTDPFSNELHRLSLLSRRRNAAVPPLSDSGGLSGRHPDSDRHELFLGAVRRQLRASVHDRHEPAALARAHPRLGVRRNVRARVFRRRSRFAMAAADLVGYNISNESTVSVELRDINGYGGFATQIGNNLAVGFHERFNTGNELYINYRKPGRRSDARPSDRQVRLPRRRGHRHVALSRGAGACRCRADRRRPRRGNGPSPRRSQKWRRRPKRTDGCTYVGLDCRHLGAVRFYDAFNPGTHEPFDRRKMHGERLFVSMAV